MSKREHVKVPSALLLFALLFGFNTSSHAALLDFMTLQEAKKAYDAGEYEKAQHLYDSVAKEAGHAEGYYNEANALYSQS
jgi:hypothetical protein